MAEAGFPPPNACDCHVHVVGPKSRYPLTSWRSYTPMEAPRDSLTAMLARLGLDRVVIVQPSFYGTNNAYTLDALDALGHRARAVAVVDNAVSATELDSMHRRGVRGLRLNIRSTGVANADTVRDRMRHAARMCARNGWHVQLFIAPDLIEALAPAMRALPVPVVIDHFGLIGPADFDSTAANCLVDLVASGQVWVKLSGSDRLTNDIGVPAMAPFARRLADANPERLVWGSDWPHTPIHSGQRHENHDAEQPYRDVDDARLLQLVPTWFEDSSLQEQVLSRNPARLYRFPEPN